jgi:argininosuccinate lyase
MMPQKKNPDVLELIRGQSALVSGAAGSLLTLLKGLPLAYNRDLQWDKHALFQAVDLVQASLEVLARVLGRVRIRKTRALELASSDSLGATDLAEYLIKRGVSSRAAHRAVGQLVAFCERQGTSLRGCSVAQMQRFSPEFDQRAKALLDPRKSVAAKQSAGSTNPQQVARALARWRAALGAQVGEDRHA